MGIYCTCIYKYAGLESPMWVSVMLYLCWASSWGFTGWSFKGGCPPESFHLQFPEMEGCLISKASVPFGTPCCVSGKLWTRGECGTLCWQTWQDPSQQWTCFNWHKHFTEDDAGTFLHMFSCLQIIVQSPNLLLLFYVSCLDATCSAFQQCF